MVALDFAHALDHTLGMAMGGIDHHHVHAGGHQFFQPFVAVTAGTEGGTDTQLAGAVLRGFGVGVGLQDVLDGHEAAQLEGVVDHQHAFEAVLVHELLGVFGAGALAHGDQALLRRHDVAHRLVQLGLEAQVTVGDDAHHLAPLDHRQAGDVMLARDGNDIAHTHAGGDGDGISDHTRLVPLDGQHFGSLLFGLEILVDDADAAQLGHDDGHAAFSHGVHRRGDERDVETDVSGQARAQRGIARDEVRVSGDEQNVVKCQCLLGYPHRYFSAKRHDSKIFGAVRCSVALVDLRYR